ncbi:VOC family protein [Enterocloster citroniae]|jgi:lactoylglutathione lyase|uniref:Lactoylglutathione lyase n=3 Tax=Enterocloster citroniae TaxID=358743 RepID=A0ABV2FT88_9FIRM|nr:VOC family protein [Enterocloster citroniae]
MINVKMDHIVISSGNPEQMKDFYIKYLGAVADSEGTVLCFKGGFRIKLMPRGPMSGSRSLPNSSGVQTLVSLAFRLGSRKRVNILTSRLVLEGHEVICEPHLSGSSHYSSSVYDPEGNIVELIA